MKSEVEGGEGLSQGVLLNKDLSDEEEAAMGFFGLFALP